MSTNPSSASEAFDMESILGVLKKLEQEASRTPEDVKAIKAAAQAILFIHLNGKLHDFQDYLLDIEKAAERLSSVERSFTSMTEALNWLHAAPDPRFGACVEVAGSPYLVVRQRREMWFLIPAPPIPSFEVKKKQKKTTGPQRDTQPQLAEAVARSVCAGLTGFALQACMSAQQQVPPVRPMPPPQECPTGAVETMTRTLGLEIGEVNSGDWSDVRGRSVQVREDTPFRVAGLWGEKLPHATLFHGRLYVGEKRVYGFFTEARTPTGETYPVCMRLYWEDEPGTPIQPGSTPEKILVGDGVTFPQGMSLGASANPED